MLKESLVKYLAGLIDADGSLALLFRPIKGGYRLQLHLCLKAATSIDKHQLIPSLPELTGVGTVTYHNETKWSDIYAWHVTKRSDLERLIPRLIKHMILKDGHFNWCLDMLRATQGTVLTAADKERLQKISTEGRYTFAHLREHTHPTWAWTAGFLDGDGYYSLRFNKQTGRTVVRCGAVCHKNARVTLDLLHKAFGGSLYEEQDWIRWHRNLGPRDSKFSLPFLAKLTYHSKLKKHKIETLIHNIKQRLSENEPTG